MAASPVESPDVRKEPEPPKSRIHCSFCGKSQDEVFKLILGPGVSICDECVDVCLDVIDLDVIEAGVGTLKCPLCQRRRRPADLRTIGALRQLCRYCIDDLREELA